MIIFMKNDPRCNANKRSGMLDKFFIKKMNGYTLFPENILSYFWYAQAALVISPIVTFGFFNLRVYKNTFVAIIAGVIICFFLIKVFNYLHAVHYKKANILVDLRRGQTDALAIIHRFPHIVYKLLQTGIFRSYVYTDFSQNRVAVGHYRKHHK